jgi:hypothetical protein
VTKRESRVEDLKLRAVSWLTTGSPVAAASASLRPASSIWNGRSVALDTTCTASWRGRRRGGERSEADSDRGQT